MTYIPSAPFGVGGAVTATTNNTVANFGASPFTSPANQSGELNTQEFLSTGPCILFRGTEPSSAANTT